MTARGGQHPPLLQNLGSPAQFAGLHYAGAQHYGASPPLNTGQGLSPRQTSHHSPGSADEMVLVPAELLHFYPSAGDGGYQHPGSVSPAASYYPGANPPPPPEFAASPLPVSPPTHYYPGDSAASPQAWNVTGSAVAGGAAGDEWGATLSALQQTPGAGDASPREA